LLPALYDRVFPRWVPQGELRPRTRSSAGASLLVRWLGTAAHVIESESTRIAIDPFVTRPSLGHVALARIAPDDRELDARFGTRLDAILCGHSHYDHLMDAPRIACATGAKLVGSRSTCAFGRATGVPESQLLEVPATGREVTIGDLSIRFVPSVHGRIMLGRVPFPGEVLDAPHLPVRARDYRMGGAFGILVRASDGATVYHNGSADLVDAELAGIHADVALVGLAGRQATRDYLARLVAALTPHVLVPTHHDAFFAPLDRGVHLLPGIDLDGFIREARRLAPRATLVTPDYFEALAVPADDPRGSAMLD
jgi:L-ascorbate metabolism protein UlaG (beta-lactamase superfamily)